MYPFCGRCAASWSHHIKIVWDELLPKKYGYVKSLIRDATFMTVKIDTYFALHTVLCHPIVRLDAFPIFVKFFSILCTRQLYYMGGSDE